MYNKIEFDNHFTQYRLEKQVLGYAEIAASFDDLQRETQANNCIQPFTID